jgi:hypothetical protein
MTDLSNRGPLGLKGPSGVIPAIRDAARGQNCTLRLPGCRNDVSTVVLAHLRRNGWAGMAQKPPDYLGVFACGHCHALQEAHRCSDGDILRALGETLNVLFRLGVIRVAGQ